MPEGTNGTGDIDAMVKICTAIDELRSHNQMLEDDVQNIKQCQHEVSPSEEMELLDPRPL